MFVLLLASARHVEVMLRVLKEAPADERRENSDHEKAPATPSPSTHESSSRPVPSRATVCVAASS